MVRHIMPVFKQKKYELSKLERELLEKAWKGQIDKKREAIRRIETIEKDAEFDQFHPDLY